MKKPLRTSPISLPHLSVLSLRGARAAECLQGQMTANIFQIPEGQGTFSAQCNRKGQVINLFFIIKHSDLFFLILPEKMITISLHALQSYALLSKVTMQHEKNMSCLGLTENSDIPENLGQVLLPSKKRSIIIVDSPQHLAVFQQNNPWREKDFEEGLPSIHPNTTALFTPEQLNLANLGAISFDKGCYTGQEIVARMHYLGKKTHGLFKTNVISEKKLHAGDPFFSDENNAMGTIVDVLKMNDHEQRILFTSKLTGNPYEPKN